MRWLALFVVEFSLFYLCNCGFGPLGMSSRFLASLCTRLLCSSAHGGSSSLAPPVSSLWLLPICLNLVPKIFSIWCLFFFPSETWMMPLQDCSEHKDHYLPITECFSAGERHVQCKQFLHWLLHLLPRLCLSSFDHIILYTHVSYHLINIHIISLS